MPAPTGNKNAEKWTLPRTLELLAQIDQHSRDSNRLYLDSALTRLDMYKDIWRYWKKKWKDNHDIISRMKMILQRFEVRIFEKMVKKEIPTSAGIHRK